MKNLYLFTDGYPYTSSEKTFLASEIFLLSKKYKITLVACVDENKKKDCQDEVQNGIETVWLNSRLDLREKIQGLSCIWSVDWWSELICALRSKNKVLSRIVYVTYYYAMALHYKKLILDSDAIILSDDSVFYTFWNTYYTYALCMLKKSGNNFRVVSRAHGYDLYSSEERGVLCQPFKRAMDRYVSRVFFVSEEGKRYYIANHADIADDRKYIVSYIGAGNSFGRNTRRGASFNIVSCSSVIPLKRVELIVDVLKGVETFINIRWVHFGGGTGYDSLAEKCEKVLGGLSNISYELKGNTDNKKILNYYASEPIDVFLTTSSSEGLPVSILEALSYGIPVIAPSINGIPEAIIDGYNGYLTDSRHVVEDSIAAIERLASLPDEKVDTMRENAYYIWSEKFNADKNAQELCEQLLSL